MIFITSQGQIQETYKENGQNLADTITIHNNSLYRFSRHRIRSKQVNELLTITLLRKVRVSMDLEVDSSVSSLREEVKVEEEIQLPPPLLSLRNLGI